MTRAGSPAERLRVERELREAVEVARDVIARRPDVRPRILRVIEDLDAWVRNPHDR